MSIMENGQDKASILDHLDHCCQLVSEKYGKPDAVQWTNSDFIRLSSILYRQTQVQISPNTLKRIFGKIKTDARYYPQKATRDSLARYAGFADWDTFTNAQLLPGQTVAVNDSYGDTTIVAREARTPISTVPAGPSRKFSRGRLGIFAGLALMIMVGLAWVGKLLLTKKEAAVTLFCQNPEGGNPHSAVFVLRGFENVGQLGDDYDIQWGDGEKTQLNTRDSVYSHYYETPGRYFAVLHKQEIPVDTVPVFLQTDGWTATANMMHDTTRVYPIEIPDLFTNGRNSVNATEIAHAGVDTNRTFFVDFINSHLTGIDGDNFELLVDIKTSPPRPGVRCSQVRLTVYGDSSNHMVDIMKPGCVHWSKLRFSEFSENDRSGGLNFLGADLTNGGTLELKVVNRHAQLLINGKEIYKNTYQKPLRHIYGLDVMFAGIGTVRSVQLKDLKTGKQFDGNF